VRRLGGRPLITHVIRVALQACDPARILVITDDDEIDAVSRAEGVDVVREPKTTGKATLDDVALKLVPELERRGAVDSDVFLTLQPTCPFIHRERFAEALRAFEADAGAILTVKEDRHLSWRLDAEGRAVPNYAARLNRQQLKPNLRESGALIGCRLGDLKVQRTRIVQPVHLITVEQEEALDIDDFHDWAVAEYIALRRSILIRADASEELGMGHAYRAVAVAQEIAHHQVAIATDSGKPLGAELFGRYPFELCAVDGDEDFLRLVQERRPDLVILDQLDTRRAYVQALREAAKSVVTFEDLGEGAVEADLVVSDLYKNLDVPGERQLSGVANAVLAPAFETVGGPAPFREKPENVLVVFGGTDPSNLTEKTLRALSEAKFDGEVTIVVGPGKREGISLENYGLRGQVLSDVAYMPGVMRTADVALSSGGRTVTELISLGVPVVCLCQNEKELTHTHASARFGVVNLGLGELVDTATIAAHLDKLLSSPKLRTILRNRALAETSGRTNRAVIERILDSLNWPGTTRSRGSGA
jgi:spore coat polysaccharide biosynthesis predicted glycosyltransferase SpsG/CMP-N-acetylneuraminic acid synthetase